MERTEVLAFIENLSRSELVDFLRDVESLQGDELGAALVAAIEARDAPLTALIAAKQALTAWAGSDATKLLYADELADIARRVAGDLET